MNELTTSEELIPLPTSFVQRINELPSTSTVCIRKQYQIPNGWVIIAETVLHEASESWPNGWVIKRPEEYETVHDQSPIPSGYVKIWHVNSSTCPGIGPNAWRIKRLYASEVS